MRAIAIIAAKEIRDGLRNRWVLATTLLMAALALTLTLLGSAPTGTVGASHLSVTVVSLSSLTIFLVPLIALLISHDAIAGEIERRAARNTAIGKPIHGRNASRKLAPLFPFPEAGSDFAESCCLA